MKRKLIIFKLFILVQSTSVLGQTINTIENIKLNLPCKLEMVYNQSSTRSYVCQALTNDIPISYRVTVEDHMNTLQKFDEKDKRAFIETYLNKIKTNAVSESKNVKSRTFYNMVSIQFDDFINTGKMVLQARTFVFFYKNKSISFNYVSNIIDFDNRFERFLSNITLNE